MGLITQGNGGSFEPLEDEVAKKDPALRLKYYEGVRELTQAMAEKANEAILQLKALGDDFVDVFEKTHKRHNALLDKVSKRIERELKKSPVAPKTAAPKAAPAKAAAPKAVAKVANSATPKVANSATPKVVKPKKAPATKRNSASKTEAAK